MDDSNNGLGSRAGVADNDGHNSSLPVILAHFDNFVSGTGNHEDFESDDNGVNMRAFVFTAGTLYFETGVEHNCVSGQDPN